MTTPSTPRFDRASCALIGVDWGTTSMRVFAMDAAGGVLQKHDCDDGILSVPDADFGTRLEDLLTGWTDSHRPAPIILSGMITSRQGWLETPYLDCPAPVSGLASALHAAHSPRGWPLWFITGLSCRRGDGTPDVMRGEETQVLGLGATHGLLVMPGTHSKWVQLRDGAVVEFTTFMTGEIFATLRKHSILGALMVDGAHDADTFARGVHDGLDAGSGLLARLFSVRTHGLFDDIAAAGLADYLSGLLIGTEFKEALAAAPHATHDITLIGRGDLIDRYARAADLAGLATHRGPEDSAAHGHHLIAREAGLI